MFELFIYTLPIILLEYLFRLLAPNSGLRPTRLIINVSIIIGNWLYKIGQSMAWIFDYMTYYHIFKRFINHLIHLFENLWSIFKNILMKLDNFIYHFFVNLWYYIRNLGRILQKLLNNIDHYLRIVCRKLYTYTPLQDIIGLLMAFCEFIGSLGRFFQGYEQYYQRLMNSFWGQSRKTLSIVYIGLIFMMIVAGYYHDIVYLYVFQYYKEIVALSGVGSLLFGLLGLFAFMLLII